MARRTMAIYAFICVFDVRVPTVGRHEEKLRRCTAMKTLAARKIEKMFGSVFA